MAHLKSRKILFDDYSNRLYFETKIESLDRKCQEHIKLANAINKCAENRMKDRHKQASDAFKIFDMRMKREKHEAVEGLLDKTAHSTVLENIGRNNSNNPSWSHSYGRYGEGKSRIELQPRIDSCKKKLNGPYIRRKAAHQILQQRRIMHVVNRSLDTYTLMRQWTRPNLSQRSQTFLENGMKSVLPPIQTAREYREDSDTIQESNDEKHLASTAPRASTHRSDTNNIVRPITTAWTPTNSKVLVDSDTVHDPRNTDAGVDDEHTPSNKEYGSRSKDVTTHGAYFSRDKEVVPDDKLLTVQNASAMVEMQVLKSERQNTLHASKSGDDTDVVETGRVFVTKGASLDAADDHRDNDDYACVGRQETSEDKETGTDKTDTHDNKLKNSDKRVTFLTQTSDI